MIVPASIYLVLSQVFVYPPPDKARTVPAVFL